MCDVDSCWFYIIMLNFVWFFGLNLKPGCILSHCTSCSHWISKGSTMSALALLPQCKKHKDFGYELQELVGISPWHLTTLRSVRCTLLTSEGLLRFAVALSTTAEKHEKDLKHIKAGKKHQTGLNFWTTMGRCGLLHMLKFTCVTFLCLYFHADCILSDLLCSF